ncbi:hypothetical protein Clacol_003153 [Clathrus columnatus]|uniref:NACHT domain-containing protein n=1 Tax=Clathrus columnatus TaxID=1419009 RepID=A0AAV5A6S7_9AGAM|nr:hypothetical protein Clacol_003153 [Clathrus columnatus]
MSFMQPRQSHDASNIDKLNREELNDSMQAASQALQSTRGVTGRQLERNDKGGYGQLAAGVVDRLSAFTNLVQNIADVVTYAQGIDQNILDLFVILDSTYKFIEETKEIEHHPSYERILSNLAKQTVECAYFIRDYAKMANFWFRAGKNLIGKPIKARVQIYQDAFDRILMEFRNHSALHTEITVGRLLEQNGLISETLSLGNLPYASGAGLHTGKQCLPGTRVEILDDIINWVNDVDDGCPRLFWLAGSAGVGKSAIAHSIALWFQRIGRLGSFFCFDRTGSIERREKVFSTIARDLADLDTQIKHELVKAIQNKTSLQSTTDLHLQFKNFLFEPLQAISQVTIGPILVVIDALDESGDPISRQELLKVITKETSSLPANIRFLVTSRPEQDIIAAFHGSQSRTQIKMMDSIPETETRRDILNYFKTNLAEPSSFGDSQLRRLVDLSQGLFQWAYLALQFLNGLGNTAGSTLTERYEDLLNVPHIESIHDHLDAMYTQVLSSLFNTKQPRVMSRFRSVIGSILAAREPLSLNSLVALRRGNVPLSQRTMDIKVITQHMGSLLSGIDDLSSAIRPLHLSFREYLLDKDRSKDFFIDLSPCHQEFAFTCLRTMKEELRFNICDIPSSHKSNAEDEDLPARISSRISVPLSYSSRFWGVHVSSAIFDPLLARKVEEFFHQDFLHWLEVLSLLKTVHVAVRSMSGLISWSLGREAYKLLYDFAVDGSRFVRSFSDAIALSAPHVYLSGLPFCPQGSLLRKTFIDRFPNTLQIASDPIHSWPLSQRTRRISETITSICFSHKGEYLALGLWGGILKLLDSESFDTLWVKEQSDQQHIDAIQFLTDDKSLVFASASGIYLFDILTGEITFQNSFAPFLGTIFSPNAKFVATLNPSNLLVWNLETVERVIDLQFDIKKRTPNSAFLNNDDGRFVTYSDIGAQVWDLETGTILHGPFPPPSDLIPNVTDLEFRVSPNGRHVIFIDDSRFFIWDFQDNLVISFDRPRIVLLTISSDGNCVITRTSDGRLVLHYINGNELYCETDRGISDIACSEDGRWLAFRNVDRLHIRELDGCQSSDYLLKPLPVDPVFINASSDGTYLLSTSVEESFEVWDVQSGQSIRKLSRDTEFTLTNPIFSPMNRYLGYISGGKFVNLYDINSGASKEISFNDPKIRLQGIAFSQDEKLLATLDLSQRAICIWDIDSPRVLETLAVPKPTKHGDRPIFEASSRFRYFAYAFHDGHVSLFDRTQPIPLELPICEQSSYETVIESFAFSLDEEYMLISRGLAVLHINLTTKEYRTIVLQLGGHMIPLQNIRLGSPTRRIYVTPNSETLLVETQALANYNVWDASSGQLLYFASEEYPRMSVKGFIPVHQYLFTTTRSDGHARISALKHNRDNRVCFSFDDQHSLQLPPGSSARLREDGWVVTQDDRLLFWVPKDYHTTLHVPGLVYILGKKSIELDLSSFLHGESWTALPGRDASQLLDPRLASFSFELAYFVDFAGNTTNPNMLTQELMARLVERTGVGPDVRPGGITVLAWPLLVFTLSNSDSSIFDQNAPALVNDLSPLANLLYLSQKLFTISITSGPDFFQSHHNFPSTSRFVVDVNLGNSSVEIAQGEIAAAINVDYKVGNEPDQYAGSIRPSNWTSLDYTTQFLNWTSILSENLDLPQHIFQSGAFAINPTSSAPMTTVSTIEEGIDSTGVVKLFDQHSYQYSTCDPVRNALATLPALVNHQNITAYLDLWIPQIAAARAEGKEFVIGEYGSVSCSGKENVTDTFGQAIWLADTVLYGASLNISRMYLHQGATLVFQSSDQANTVGFSWYDLWYPIPSDRYGSARASPSFVAYLLITEAVGSSGRSQLQLINIPEAPHVAAYVIWDDAVKSDGIARLAIINTAISNITTPAKENGSVVVDLKPFLNSKQRSNDVVVKRMTSPGVDSKNSDLATWAGQAFTNGTASGREVVETLKDGEVTVRGSEAVLVFF